MAWIAVYRALLAVILVLIHNTDCWHDFTNHDFHCWPHTASASDPGTWTCAGVSMEWIDPPPDEIKAEEPFTLSYSLVIDDAEFWPWAVLDIGKTNIFSTQGITDATNASDWCRNTVCSTDLTIVAQDNCCIWHVNVHSCPLEDVDYCGPWIQPAGTVYTHSDVLWGALGAGSHTNWTSAVGGLYKVGTTQLIAHIKFAGFQVALQKNIIVLPKTECGNADCEAADGETCSTCPADCGRCPLSAGAIAAIVVVLVIILVAIIAVIVDLYEESFFGKSDTRTNAVKSHLFFRIKQYRLMWDESWIIPYDEIKPDKAGVGLLGSRMSLHSSVASQQGGLMSNMQAQAMVKQIFCKTALYKGKSVAVKHVPKKQLNLTKDVRKEVKSVRSLEHQNLAKFVGASIDVPNVNIVTEYCPKGSLNDALLNDSIPLNWSFRFSMATDIARGMAYIHSRGIYHGKLKSTNCIIDDRWTVKITDFGIPILREIQKKNRDKKHSIFQRSSTESSPSHQYQQSPSHFKSEPISTKTQHSYNNQQHYARNDNTHKHILPVNWEQQDHLSGATQDERTDAGFITTVNNTRIALPCVKMGGYLPALDKTSAIQSGLIKAVSNNQVAPAEAIAGENQNSLTDGVRKSGGKMGVSIHIPPSDGDEARIGMDKRKKSIIDFGLDVLRNGEKTEDEEYEEWEEEEMYKKKRSKVYLAPEFLGEKNPVATQGGDMYAYAIILTEIGTRNDPYQDEDPDSVEENWKPPQPDFADESREDRCPSKSQYLALIRECWHDNPVQRPTFDYCKKQLHRMNPNKMSPVDIMMAMMEKYSKHLETLVAERTAEVTVEKEKADRLLYSMIPQAVAEDLKRGKTVKAEQYSTCSIYFSDIVGFTNLSGGSTAMEVVALLNDLYICFDTIIDMYDVYKVETIGDAYMVVSGVPKTNGIRHAREVAHMACDLRDASKVFKIRHKPGEALKIRIGIHSGPVCAGVVGLKMPRYCLFGDTVNTASRMESNGETYKIHLSSFTYDHLITLGGFKFEKRGTIPVKGKGDMTTYWLTDRDEVPSKKLDTSDAKRKISNSNDSGYNDDQNKPSNNGGLPKVFEKREPPQYTAGSPIELTMLSASNPSLENGKLDVDDTMPLVE